MRPKDLLKIASHGDFAVLRIVKEDNKFFLLKKLAATTSPVWCVEEKSSCFSDIEFRLELFRNSYKYILNITNSINKSDIINLTEAGFKVIRLSLSDKQIIKLFNPLKGSWVKLISFPKVSLRDDYLLRTLYDRSTILVD